MSRYFWTCPECGANLESNERCEDCQDKKKEPHGGQPTRLNQKRTVTVFYSQYNIFAEEMQ
jgi:predicted amidophosphoribosyltransferase